ncbi:MAG: hypothetical protein RBT36_03180, partial [Desulfobulbus sp.]|nr:hypothetical protein [Desulfobulbus sp.]
FALSYRCVDRVVGLIGNRIDRASPSFLSASRALGCVLTAAVGRLARLPPPCPTLSRQWVLYLTIFSLI